MLQVKAERIPTTFIYSDVDRVMSNKMSKDLLQLLDASAENADIYDKNGTQEQRGKSNNGIWCYCIRIGYKIRWIELPNIPWIDRESLSIKIRETFIAMRVSAYIWSIDFLDVWRQ